MINELYSLAKTLDNNEISTEQSNDMYLPLRGKYCIRIWISDTGTVSGIEQLSSELTASLKTYGNDHNSFPVFNLKQLYRVTDKEIIDQLIAIENGSAPVDIKKLRSWCLEDNWIKDAAGKVERSLQRTAQELLTALGDSTSNENTVLGKAVQLSSMFFSENAVEFKRSLEQYIFRAIEAGEDRKLLLNILFYKGNSSKEHKNDQGINLPIVIDVEKWADYGHPVASEATTKWINQKLLDSVSYTSQARCYNERQDAFGDSMENTKGPMPLVMINGKQISLRTMFHEHLCQHKYRKYDDGSYPVSTKNRKRLAGAANWIASTNQKGVTWDTIADDEVLFAYPTTLPEIPVRLTAIFGSPDGAERMHARFESEARKFITVMRGMPTKSKPEYINLFIFKKTDTSNATSKRGRVIFTHNSTPEQIIKAADDWTLGCRNLPKLEVGELITPFPLDVAGIVNSVWKQNGERADGKAQVERMKYYQGMELLLGILPHSAVHYFLHTTVENSSGLINHLGNWFHSDGKCENNAEARRLESMRNAAAPIFSILGLLLYNCDKRKANYMEELAYLLGQLLHISDELHTLYCKIQRKGDIPPQLVGSALFVTAGEMPYQALSQLSLRMNPYISWAKQYRYKDVTKEEEESWRAKWLLGLFERISNKVSPQMDKSIRFGDYEKAQLFIGYMASLPKKEISDESAATDENVIVGGIDNE